VKNIGDYNSNVSETSLFYYLYGKITSREIDTFPKLKSHVAPILQDKRTHLVIMKAFELIKRLYWGFFCTIDPKTHKNLWKELVIQDAHFPEAGDLKRTLQISNLYVGMIDISGYTKFCMDSRKNLSMMHTLDWAIENEIQRISTQCGAVSQRERGDEIVVVAASATDILMAVLCIIDYLGKTSAVNDFAVSTQRTGNAQALPVFKASAGITGGNTQSPLIITEKGNLSGFLLNSGARLQTRANELSSTESRIMIAKQVEMNYQKENMHVKCPLAANDVIYFMDTGQIEFKGVIIPTCEVVYDKKDHYKREFREELDRLFSSIREKSWEQRVYVDLVELLQKVAMVMPQFSIPLSAPPHGMQILTLTNDSYMSLCRLAAKAYTINEDYYTAVKLLHDILSVSEQIPSFDRLIIDYIKGISEKYDLLLQEYLVFIDSEIDKNAVQIFQEKNYTTWLASKNGVQIHSELREIGRKSKIIAKKKTIWYNLIKRHSEDMDFALYSGKK